MEYLFYLLDPHCSATGFSVEKFQQIAVVLQYAIYYRVLCCTIFFVQIGIFCDLQLTTMRSTIGVL